jgi:hypothetical protein
MYSNQRKRKINLGQRKITLGLNKFMISVDHDRINNDPMFLKLIRRAHCRSAIGIEIPIIKTPK